MQLFKSLLKHHWTGCRNLSKRVTFFILAQTHVNSMIQEDILKITQSSAIPLPESTDSKNNSA